MYRDSSNVMASSSSFWTVMNDQQQHEIDVEYSPTSHGHFSRQKKQSSVSSSSSCWSRRRSVPFSTLFSGVVCLALTLLLLEGCMGFMMTPSHHQPFSSRPSSSSLFHPNNPILSITTTTTTTTDNIRPGFEMRMATSGKEEDDNNQVEQEEIEEEEDEFLIGDAGTGFVLEDLSWRVEKLRLEEANKRRFLSARPRFLPYE